MTEGMVSSPCPIASEAGAAVLRRGGNAYEAAIAVSAMLAVSMPHFCGLGGDAVWLVAGADGRAEVLMGIGQAAAAARTEAPIPLRGPQAALTTACLVASWQEALVLSRAVGGAGDLAALIAPAITAAREGVPVTASHHYWLSRRLDEARAYPDFARIFLPGGAVPQIGSTLAQPDLAMSLQALSDGGPRAFYEGALATRMAEGLAAAGSPIRAADLAATRCRRADPLRLTYRGEELLAPPQPTQGLATLEAMGILGQFPPAALRANAAQHIHLAVEAIKRAFLDRAAIADPDFGALADAAELLAPDYLAAQAARIDPARALPWPQPWRHGDTVWFGVTDAEGHSASVLQSTYFDWGSFVMAGETGILWQNRGAAFSHDPAHPNALAPGKRPFYTLNPGMSLRAGRPHLLYGTQGADGQPQTLVLLLTALIDLGLSPEAALRLPRFLLGRTFSDSRDTLKIEEDVGADVLATLAALGHELSPIEALSPLAGTAGVIRRLPDGAVEGGHDPRGGGVAIRVGQPPRT